MEGVRQNAKENGQIRPPACRPGAWNGSGRRHRPPVLREGQKSANIPHQDGIHLGESGLNKMGAGYASACYNLIKRLQDVSGVRSISPIRRNISCMCSLLGHSERC